MSAPNRRQRFSTRIYCREGKSIQISVSRVVAGHPLQDGPAHPGYLKPYFLLAERVYKSCERRKFSCRHQRSSGVAARLRANKYFSSSLRPRTRRSFASIRATFFCTVGSYLPSALASRVIDELTFCPSPSFSPYQERSLGVMLALPHTLIDQRRNQVPGCGPFGVERKSLRRDVDRQQRLTRLCNPRTYAKAA